jgi:hypothetical protein
MHLKKRTGEKEEAIQDVAKLGHWFVGNLDSFASFNIKGDLIDELIVGINVAF